MKRAVVTVALGAVAFLAVPVTPASACTPAIPTLTLDRDRVARGSRVHATGKQVAEANGRVHTFCDGLYASVTPSPTPVPVAPSPDDTPSPTATPLVSLPPLAKVAFVPARPVTFTIEEHREWPQPPAKARTLTTVAVGSRVRYDEKYFTFSFATDVTIPRDVAPGEYVLKAYEEGSVYYGEAHFTVTNGLASTGPAAPLGWLAVATVGAAVVASRAKRA